MPSLVIFGDLLEPELQMLRLRLREGSVAVDVGSSIGTWTMAAARLGAQVHACEPDVDSIDTLEANCRANHLEERVTVRRIGLGAAPGQGTLLVQKRRYMNRIRTDGAASGAVAGTATDEGFPILTLDGLVEAEGLTRIDILKINTAGGERDVVAGGMGLFRRGAVDLVLVLDGLEVRPVLDEVRELGYEMGIWDGEAQTFVHVAGSSFLDSVTKGPMNRYVVLARKD
jgi:FkbM family methyltransferase